MSSKSLGQYSRSRSASPRSNSSRKSRSRSPKKITKKDISSRKSRSRSPKKITEKEISKQSAKSVSSENKGMWVSNYQILPCICCNRKEVMCISCMEQLPHKHTPYFRCDYKSPGYLSDLLLGWQTSHYEESLEHFIRCSGFFSSLTNQWERCPNPKICIECYTWCNKEYSYQENEHLVQESMCKLCQQKSQETKSKQGQEINLNQQNCRLMRENDSDDDEDDDDDDKKFEEEKDKPECSFCKRKIQEEKQLGVHECNLRCSCCGQCSEKKLVHPCQNAEARVELDGEKGPMCTSAVCIDCLRSCVYKKGGANICPCCVRRGVKPCQSVGGRFIQAKWSNCKNPCKLK